MSQTSQGSIKVVLEPWHWEVQSGALMAATVSGDVVENELCWLSCAAHSTAHGVLSRLSPRRDFLNFAFHGEMKTAVNATTTALKTRHHLMVMMFFAFVLAEMRFRDLHCVDRYPELLTKESVDQLTEILWVSILSFILPIVHRVLVHHCVYNDIHPLLFATDVLISAQSSKCTKCADIDTRYGAVSVMSTH